MQSRSVTGSSTYKHMTYRVPALRSLCEGLARSAQEAVWVLDHLDGRSRSLPESETRAILAFAGLAAAPEVNVALDDGPEPQVIVDLLLQGMGAGRGVRRLPAPAGP